MLERTLGDFHCGMEGTIGHASDLGSSSRWIDHRSISRCAELGHADGPTVTLPPRRIHTQRAAVGVAHTNLSARRRLPMAAARLVKLAVVATLPISCSTL